MVLHLLDPESWTRTQIGEHRNHSLLNDCKQSHASVPLRMAVDAWQRLQEVYRRAGAAPSPAFSMDQGQHVCALQCPPITVEGQTLEVHACIGYRLPDCIVHMLRLCR